MKISFWISYILVEFDHRKVKITGEYTVDRIFHLDEVSIKNWETPYDKIPISNNEKNEIIASVLQYPMSDLKLIFD